MITSFNSTFYSHNKTLSKAQDFYYVVFHNSSAGSVQTVGGSLDYGAEGYTPFIFAFFMDNDNRWRPAINRYDNVASFALDNLPYSVSVTVQSNGISITTFTDPADTETYVFTVGVQVMINSLRDV